jgi:hypothetical protein
VKAAAGRPVLTVVGPADIPDHRRGFGWWWFKIREAAGTVRWHILTAVAATVAAVAPRVHGQAWREGFDAGFCCPSARTWRQHLDSWRQGNEVAHEIVYRRHGQAWDGSKFTLLRPLLVPDPAGLSNLVNELAEEQLEWSAAARAQAAAEQARQSAATSGRNWCALRRILSAAAVMATAAVAADDQRVTALADVVATRRIVVIEGRHAATPDHPGRRRPDRSRPAPRHARPRWRSLVARWLRDAIPRTAGGPLRAAA